MTRVISIAALLALAGCTVGPNYAAPETPAPESWSEALAGGERASPADAAQWWTHLNDATLSDLVTRALESNIDLREAAARIREARALRGIVASDRLPTVDAAGSYTRQRDSENAFSGGEVGDRGDPYDLYTLGFDASWELDFFGRVRRSVEAADADLAASIEDYAGVRVTLVAEVARNYVELRSFQTRLAIAMDTLRSQEETLGLSQSRYDAGLTSELDVARARSIVEGTRSQIPTFESGQRAAIHRLSVLVGQMPGTLAPQLETPAAIPVAPAEVALGLPSELLRRRPDIRAAERRLAAATARIGVATADLYPRFSLFGTLGFESSQIGSLLEGDSLAWSIGPAFRWNVFDAGRIRSGIEAQDARTDQALARYETTVLTAYEEAENAIVAYAREQTRRESLTAAVAAQQHAFDLASELYTRGLTNFEPVLDTQRALYILQDQLAQSDATVTSNLIALYKALGGGWDVPEDQPLAEDQPTAEEIPAKG